MNAELSSIPFDPYRRVAHHDLAHTVSDLAAALERQELALGRRSRQRKPEPRAKFRAAVEAVTCNLLLANCRPLSVPKSSAAMWGSRYAAPVYGQPFLDALTIMAHPDVGLIASLRKGYRFPGNAGRYSAIAATPRLLETVMGSGTVDWSCFKRDAEREPLELRAAKSVPAGPQRIEYRDSTKTRAMRNAVQRLNGWLAEAPLIVAPGPVVDPTRRSVRRIFNNGRWDHGGRLYGGFWITMPKEDRFRFLRIGTEARPEGEAIASVDYGQLFPRLAYVRAQRQVPDGDLYAVLSDPRCRPGVKRIFSALLFGVGSLTRWPDGTRQHFAAGTKLATVVAAIKERHPAIAPLFGTGIGHTLAFMESNVLMEVLDALRREGITALPVHDAVLVAASKAEATKAIMQAVLEPYLLGFSPAVVSIQTGGR